jgi:hypothetical protein
MAMAKAKLDINHGAPVEEWEDLYKWVKSSTLTFSEAEPDKRNPWLMPDLTREEIIQKIHSGQGGGWLGYA